MTVPTPASPWLRIPAGDYEAHMDAVGQSRVLRALFAKIYTERRPTSLAVLGCSTGGDLLTVDDAITHTVVGVDLNADYLAIARERLGRRVTAADARVHLVHDDVSQVDLPAGAFELIHAALLLEYVDPSPLFARISRWLSATGTLSLITQEPREGLPAVSDTGYASLRALSGHMVLRPGAAVAGLARGAGFRLVAHHDADLASGKRLVGLCFQKSESVSD
jgi:SAM-dependent methyltransferase